MPCSIETSTVSSRHSGSRPHRATRLQLLRLAKGWTRWTVDGETFQLREGDIVVVKPGQIFSGIVSTESVSVEVESIEIQSKCESLHGILVDALGLNPADARSIVGNLESKPVGPVRVTNEVQKSFSDLVGNDFPDTGFHELYRRLTISRILASICRAGDGEKATALFQRSNSERAVADFLAELETRCDEEWTLDAMAESTGLKRSRFGTLCRHLTGESPATRLNRLRIRRGRRLLSDTDRSVTDIAFDCGFASSQYFAKIFRRFQGHEPTHYRRLARTSSRGGSVQYLKGDFAQNEAVADRDVGAGDFCIEATIALDQLGGTAASLEFGQDRVGFDGREGRIFLEGGTFGDARFFERSAKVIREGNPFSFKLARCGNELSFSIGKHTIFQIEDNPTRPVGNVGLRPLRNGIRALEFMIDGTTASLRTKNR